MTLLKLNQTRWLLRGLLALAFAVTGLIGMTGQALADDDDDEVVTYGPKVCTVVADLPAYQPATCTKHKTELDDGVTETTNYYVTAKSANDVRLAFEKAFGDHAWTIVKSEQDLQDQEYDYTAVKGLRRVKVEIEAQEPHEGTGTEIKVEVR